MSRQTASSWLIFAAQLTLSGVLGWKALHETFVLALDREEYTHLLLILPVAAALLWLHWKPIVVAAAPYRGKSAYIAVAPAVAMLAWLRFTHPSAGYYASVAMFAVVTWWIASFMFCFGLRSSRIARFPLAFLYFLVPWPQSLVLNVVTWLQRESALAAKALFAVARIPAQLDGTILALPGLTLNVAPECSSIRSSLLLLVTTMVFAHLFLQSPWRKALLVAAAIALSPIKNGLRIFVIAFLTLRVDPSYLMGWLHERGGFVFLAWALAMILALLRILRRSEPKQRATLLTPHSQSL